LPFKFIKPSFTITKEKKDLEASYEKIEKEKYEMLFFYNERFIETEVILSLFIILLKFIINFFYAKRGYKKLNELLENEKKENAWLLYIH
jgi:rRNA maturation protein Rpf1